MLSHTCPTILKTTETKINYLKTKFNLLKTKINHLRHKSTPFKINYPFTSTKSFCYKIKFKL